MGTAEATPGARLTAAMASLPAVVTVDFCLFTLNKRVASKIHTRLGHLLVWVSFLG